MAFLKWMQTDGKNDIGRKFQTCLATHQVWGEKDDTAMDDVLRLAPVVKLGARTTRAR